jgi:hypothetical protein
MGFAIRSYELMATPCFCSFTTSSRNACGSNTMPLPITASFEGRSTPDGKSASCRSRH